MRNPSVVAALSGTFCVERQEGAVQIHLTATIPARHIADIGVALGAMIDDVAIAHANARSSGMLADAARLDFIASLKHGHVAALVGIAP